MAIAICFSVKPHAVKQGNGGGLKTCSPHHRTGLVHPAPDSPYQWLPISSAGKRHQMLMALLATHSWHRCRGGGFLQQNIGREADCMRVNCLKTTNATRAHKHGTEAE